MTTLPNRLRAHYQECDTCNRDLLLAADLIEDLSKMLERQRNASPYEIDEGTLDSDTDKLLSAVNEEK